MNANLEELIFKIKNNDVVVIAQIAPSVRATIGEMFEYPPGSIVTGEFVSALKSIGFDYVFDTSLGADITVTEERHEMEERIKSGKNLPLFNSCCPGSVSYILHRFPELTANVCSLKSPMGVLGTLIKTYFSEKTGIDASSIYSVAIMPCVIKKIEANKPYLRIGKKKAVDLVITTREIGELLTLTLSVLSE